MKELMKFIDINNYKNKYKYTKIYEDKIYNKIKKYLN